MARAEVRSAARRAESNPAFETAARAGYAADGIVHILIGVLAVAVALGGDGETDQPGALRAVAGAPLGFVALWLAALALAALGVWQVLEGILVPRRDAKRRWAARLVEWGKAAVFLGLGVLSAAVAIGARPDPDEGVQSASRGLLQTPAGPWVLGAIGVGVAASGIGFAIVGVRRKYLDDLELPDGPPRTIIRWTAVVGYVAKGFALLAVGVLLVVAAVKAEPEDAGGMDAAIDGLVALPLGPPLCFAIGVGLIAYGVYLVLCTRLRRL